MKTHKPIHIETSPEFDVADPAVIGIDIGNTNHTAALVGRSGEALEIVRGQTDRGGGPAALLASLQQLITDLRSVAAERELSVAGVGAGFGGPVDYASGRVRLSHQTPGWEDFPLRSRLEEMTGLPVSLDNDANAGGLGELLFGAGRGAQDAVYYNIGTGIGGAVILSGSLHRGASAMAGELGHITVDPNGPICTCGQRGCLEILASGATIRQRLNQLDLPPDDRRAAARDLFALVEAGQPAAISLLNEVVGHLSVAIRNVLHVLNPEVVIIGGGVSSGGELLLTPLRKAVKARSLPAAYEACRIVKAELGYDAGVIGAAALALEGWGPVL